MASNEKFFLVVTFSWPMVNVSSRFFRKQSNKKLQLSRTQFRRTTQKKIFLSQHCTFRNQCWVINFVKVSLSWIMLRRIFVVMTRARLSDEL
jgi:hypothetical protein